jgi:5-methylcytosine-specific restriction endonuclease McrA
LRAQQKHNAKRLGAISEWKKTPQGKLSNRTKTRRYRARLSGAVGSHTEEEWQALLEQHDHKCVVCGTTENITRDHIIPLSKGGSDFIENIQPMCMVDNSRKNDQLNWDDPQVSCGGDR